MESLLFDIGIIIIISSLFIYLARLLKQPVIPAYILAGFVLLKLNILTDKSIILPLSQLGIAFMLFTVGLELDFKKIKNFIKVSLLGGAIQVLVTGFIGFAVSQYLGFSKIVSFYLALVVAFSSTMIVVKLLYDREEIDTLHGKIAIGILLFQDIAAILALSFLTVADSFSMQSVLVVSVKLMLLIIIMYVLNFILPSIFKFAAKSAELLLLLSLAVCFSFIFLAVELQLSMVIGAFLAGLLLANTPYKFEILGRMSSIRDFFVALFFTSLGLELTLSSISLFMKPLIVILLLIVLVKPFIVFLITSLFGYERKTSFLSSISLSQTSEFSLVLAYQGLSLHQLPNDISSLIIVITVTTIIITTYLLKFDRSLFKVLSKHLKVFENNPKRLGNLTKEHFDVVLLGCNRMGYSILRTLRKLNVNFAVVDYDPEVVDLLMTQNIQCVYGDATDPEVLDKIKITKAKLVISTLPDPEDNLFILKFVKQNNPKAFVFLTAIHLDDALQFYDLGADYVIVPHFLGGDYAALLVEKFSQDFKSLVVERIKHIQELKRRKHMASFHPLKKENGQV